MSAYGVVCPGLSQLATKDTLSDSVTAEAEPANAPAVILHIVKAMTGNIIPIYAGVPQVREAVDQILQSIWTPPAEPMPNSDDVVLLAAAWEFRRLQRFSRGLERGRGREERPVRATEREISRLDTRWNALFDFIHLTPAAGLAGAAIKLRMLTDREIGIGDLLENAEAELTALRDVRRVVEREAKIPAGTRPVACR